jgi:putative membrane protein
VIIDLDIVRRWIMDKSKTAWIIGGTVLGLLVLIPFVVSLVSGWQYGGWGMMGPGMMGGFAGMGLMSLFWMVVLGLIIWAVVAGVRSIAGSRGTDYAAASPTDVLKRRYARGEISKEEYLDKRKNLA